MCFCYSSRPEAPRDGRGAGRGMPHDAATAYCRRRRDGWYSIPGVSIRYTLVILVRTDGVSGEGGKTRRARGVRNSDGQWETSRSTVTASEGTALGRCAALDR